MMSARIRRPLMLLLAAALSTHVVAREAAAAPDRTISEGDSQGGPVRLDIVERTGITLILLDVEVTDERGRPLPGLTEKDFRLQLDYRSWPIYSVDDLCSAPGGPDGPAVGREPSPRPAEAIDAAPPPASPGGIGGAPTDRSRYVLYFDFSQLRLLGRKQALDAARRWVREVMQPGDQIMIAAYTTHTGLRLLSPFTEDSEKLQSLIDDAYENRELIDEFPSRFSSRVRECYKCVNDCVKDLLCRDCVRCCPCYANALQEYQHGRRALDALRILMERLAELPGRKAVLFFHETSTMSPGRFYPIADPDHAIGTHDHILEDVGAEATTARAAVYPVYHGDHQFQNGLARQAVNVGANLADFTGGKHNRSPQTRFSVMEAAGRGGECTYRIGFKPPDDQRSEVYEARVEAAGNALPYRYRVQHLTDADRTMRRARAVLAGAIPAEDLIVTAALLPVSATKRRWEMAIQVGLDVSSLGLLLAGDREVAELDVGALLYREENGKSWEMLTGSTVRRRRGSAASGVLLYENVLRKLKPGEYTLKAFVRNRALDLYGRADASIRLPKPKKTGFAGPVAVCPGRETYTSPLPLRERGAAREGRVIHARMGAAPLGESAVKRGEPLQIVSWICPPAGSPLQQNMLRFITKDNVPIYRLPEGWMERSGPCVRFTDLFHTIELGPGTYDYRILWRNEEDGPPVSRTVGFVVMDETTRAVIPASR